MHSFVFLKEYASIVDPTCDEAPLFANVNRAALMNGETLIVVNLENYQLATYGTGRTTDNPKEAKNEADIDYNKIYEHDIKKMAKFTEVRDELVKSFMDECRNHKEFDKNDEPALKEAEEDIKKKSEELKDNAKKIEDRSKQGAVRQVANPEGADKLAECVNSIKNSGVYIQETAIGNITPYAKSNDVGRFV
jgi:hypothetical protein